ncbi:MAG: ferredoxin [Minisyncoccia bacterium]|jgi:ferredoxin
MSNVKKYPRNRPGSKIGEIAIDRDLCIGAVSCVAVSSETFELDGENKVVAKGPDAADDDMLIMAAESCPTKAILLFDKDGRQIFPK